MGISWPRLTLIISLAALCGSAVAYASSITVSLVNPGPATVRTGTAVPLSVQATFDTRLSAVSFQLAASGAPGVQMTDRSLNPTGPNGLTHVSTTSQSPYQSNLPHDLKALPLLDVAYDNDFDATPSGPTDGLPAGSNVVLEDVTVVVTGAGVSSVTVSNVAAVHTTTSPTGKSFDAAGVGTATVQINVAPYGDVDLDLDVDLNDYATFPGCMTGPDLGPETPPCDVFDFNRDDDVDLGDFASFQLGFTIP